MDDLVEYVRYEQDFSGMCEWKIEGEGKEDDSIYTHFKEVYEMLVLAGNNGNGNNGSESDQE